MRRGLLPAVAAVSKTEAILNFYFWNNTICLSLIIKLGFIFKEKIISKAKRKFDKKILKKASSLGKHF